MGEINKKKDKSVRINLYVYSLGFEKLHCKYWLHYLMAGLYWPHLNSFWLRPRLWCLLTVSSGCFHSSAWVIVCLELLKTLCALLKLQVLLLLLLVISCLRVSVIFTYSYGLSGIMCFLFVERQTKNIWLWRCTCNFKLERVHECWKDKN